MAVIDLIIKLQKLKENLETNSIEKEILIDIDELIDEFSKLKLDEASQTKDILDRVETVSNTGSWIYDLILEEVWWSDELFRIYGRDKSKGAPGDDWFNTIHKDDVQKIQDALQSALKTGKYDCVYRLYREDNGEMRYIHGEADLEFTDDGRPHRYIGIAEDITLKREKELELVNLNSRLSLALKSADMGIWDYDAKENKLYWDDRMMEIYQADRENFKYDVDEWASRIHPDDVERATKEVYDALDEKAPFDTSFRIVINNEVKHIRAFATTLKNENGEAYRMIGINYDVTDQMKLEQTVQQTQKLEAIGQLAGGIAHDFNNMLGGILTSIDLLKMTGDNLSAPQLKSINLIEKASKRASGLTKQLLNFSRKGKFLNTEVNVNKIVNDTVELLSRSVDKKISFKTEYENDKFVVEGDPSQIQSMIMNLAINSADAMPNGGEITIELNKKYLEDFTTTNSPFDIEKGYFLHIRVKDHGKGIPDHLKDKIFEPFFTTKEQGKGTGLGLAGVYGAVIQHKGAINFYSEKDIGTIFHIYLPLKSSENDEHKVDEVNNLGGTGTILVIDDEEVIRESAELILEKLGYKVDLAENGIDGAEIYKNGKYDLVILDMIMPEMNGLETFRILKDYDENIKVVISSGFTRSSDIDTVIKEGALDFIPKPYQISELNNLISKVLKS